MMESKVIYVPVSVQEELPEVSQDVFAFHDKDDWESQCFISPDDGKWYNTWDGNGDLVACYPTHWLKKIEFSGSLNVNMPIHIKKIHRSRISKCGTTLTRDHSFISPGFEHCVNSSSICPECLKINT